MKRVTRSRRPARAQARFTHLGAAGWEITDGQRVILLDPYLSRLRYRGRFGTMDTPELPGDTRHAFAMGEELASSGITAVAVTPGFLRSEAMLQRFGVTEANWRDAARTVMGFEESETPCFVGRAILISESFSSIDAENCSAMKPESWRNSESNPSRSRIISRWLGTAPMASPAFRVGVQKPPR